MELISHLSVWLVFMDMVQGNHLYAKFQITSNKRLIALRIASLNVGSMRGTSCEVVDTVFRRGIDLCCAHEFRWRGASTRMLGDKECHYKFWGLAQAVLECCRQRHKLIDKIFDVKYVSDRLMMIKLDACEVVLTALLLFSIYFPQSGLTISDIE